MPNPETPGFFPAMDGTPLHGVYHAPEADAKGVCVFAPPLFEERKSAYGGLTQLARALAGLGFGAFRFDYRGSGESGGDGGQRRWVHLAEDLQAACEAARKLSGTAPVTLVSTRLGATLALTETARVQPAAVVAIAPVLKGGTEARLWRLRSKMRAELSGGEDNPGADGENDVLDMDGFPVSPGFLEDLKPIDLLAGKEPCEVPTLVVQVSHRDVPSAEYERLLKGLGIKARLSCVKALPFWERVEDADVSGTVAEVVKFVKDDQPISGNPDTSC